MNCSSFINFIGKLLESGSKMSVAEAVTEFQLYKEELDQLRETLQESEERLQQGEYVEIDAEALKREAQQRWKSSVNGENA
ncbi:hypothetical protein [Blastopirellula retiformator]|uniref:Uncharacterized protein n=1 Tax=Blastopirellula retiformator TaxID=2527970 RepID=A0A5C5VJF8_9BACT|nr:hypothetical protein [Blastopirellula retiformator]TWT38724.1 hypothetical protein Enr8_04180 [Blastopirellula retiformator]